LLGLSAGHGSRLGDTVELQIPELLLRDPLRVDCDFLQGRGGEELWRRIGYSSVLKPLLSVSEGVRLWSYLREVLGSRRAHTDSVLDPAPLTVTVPTRPSAAARIVAWSRL